MHMIQANQKNMHRVMHMRFGPQEKCRQTSDFLQVSFTNILKKCGKRSSDQGHLCWCMLWRYPPLNACYSKCLRKNDSLSRVKNVCISFRIVQLCYSLVARQHQVKKWKSCFNHIISIQTLWCLCDVPWQFLDSESLCIMERMLKIKNT